MNKLDKDTFIRFKLIQKMVKKYSIRKFDISEINTIKDAYHEYIPKYETVVRNLKFEDNQFIDKELMKEIRQMKHYIHIKTDLVDIKISYFHISDSLITRIYSIVLMFQKLYGMKKVILIIALTTIKREINKKIIGTLAVNGGATDGVSIEIYRGQEVLKVLCHELCHFFKLDCHQINKNKHQVFNKFNIKNDDKITLSLSESLNEYMAMIHHIAIISYYTKKSPLLIYHYEKIWSLHQVCNILNHYGINKFEDLYEKKFEQETNVFSYYIIKFFLLWKLDNTCTTKNINNVLDDKEIIKVINENIKGVYNKGLTMTLFELSK
jgi:hypothetical protein